MNDPRRFRLDRRALARSFERASTGYEAAATLQRAARDELLERLQYFRLDPQCVIDLGAGTGDATVLLRRRFRKARLVAIDIAPGMLRTAGKRLWPWRRFDRVCADAHHLPLADASVDLVFCNLMLQWSDEPHALLAEARRVLKSGGLLLFSTFGPETLIELRSAWSAADGEPHVSEFPDMPQLGDALVHAGFVEPVIDIDRRVVHYADAKALARELRAIGALNADARRRRGLTGRGLWRTMGEHYERRRGAAGLPATWEIIYGAAFAGVSPGRLDPAEQRIPPAAIGRRRRDRPS